ncbi:MAG: hypothetical protein ACK4ZU_10870 [Allorhizobium sp.]
MHVIMAWKDWWDGIGHVARCNRDAGRTREAFEAGYLAALEQTPSVRRPYLSVFVESTRELDRRDGLEPQ